MKLKHKIIIFITTTFDYKKLFSDFENNNGVNFFLPKYSLLYLLRPLEVLEDTNTMKIKPMINTLFGISTILQTFWSSVVGTLYEAHNNSTDNKISMIILVHFIYRKWYSMLTMEST